MSDNSEKKEGSLVSVGALWSAEGELSVRDVPFTAEEVIYTGKLGEANCVVAINGSKVEDKYPDYYLYAVGSRDDIGFAVKVGALWKYTGKSEYIAANGKFGRSNLIVMANGRKENENQPDMYMMVGRAWPKEKTTKGDDRF